MTTLVANRSDRQKGVLGTPVLGAKKNIAVIFSPGQAKDKDSRQLPALEVKEKPRKIKKKTDKKKSASGSKKRGHSSTPSNSDDADKLLSEAVSSGPEAERTAVCQAKVKGRKGRGKIKGEEPGAATPPGPPPAPPPGDDGRSGAAQESLRWEGTLSDPRAEEERLEVYRANRRRRYYLSGHFGGSAPPEYASSALGREWGHYVPGRGGRT